jgi:hypothetical protein
VVKDDFHWQDGYHVPLKYNPDVIERGAKAEVHLVPTSTIVLPTDLIGQRQTDVQRATEDALLNRSRWKGNRDGTGLDLTWETGEQVMIRQADGSVVPYSRTYEQLSRLGTQAQSSAPSGGPAQVPNAY